MNNWNWRYQAKLVRVIDGDTVELDVDLGFRVLKRDRFRILGIDTPELNSSDASERAHAIAAKDFVIEALSGASEIEIYTYKSDKYGRWLANINYKSGSEWYDLGGELLGAGLASPYL